MAPVNGNVTFTETVAGSTANYSCFSTYQIAGDALRTCQDDGAWSGDVPSCVVLGTEFPEDLTTTYTIIGSVLAVFVVTLIFIIILVVGWVFYYRRRVKVQPPSYYTEPVVFGLRR